MKSVNQHNTNWDENYSDYEYGSVQIESSISQVASASSSCDKSLQSSINTDHDGVGHDNDHHVAKSDACQIDTAVELRNIVDTNLILYLDKEKADDCWY